MKEEEKMNNNNWIRYAWMIAMLRRKHVLLTTHTEGIVAVDPIHSYSFATHTSASIRMIRILRSLKAKLQN